MMTRSSKKRGRPTAQESALKYLREIIHKQEADIAQLQSTIEEQSNAITGYKAVVSYLEFHLGMKESQ